MNHKIVFIALLVFLNSHTNLLAKSSQDTKVQLEQYFNSINSMEATFTQSSSGEAMPDSISTGKLWLQKPGKLRIDYFEPKKLTVIVTNGKVMYYDHELDEISHTEIQSPLLKLLYEQNVELEAAIIASSSERIIVETFDYDTRIKLTFDKEPEIALKEIETHNPDGSIVNLVLTKVSLNKAINKSLFQFRNPKFFRLNK